MSMITAAVDLLFDADAYQRTVNRLHEVEAERDAALARVAVLEEALQAAQADKVFYFDMVAANEAWQKAKRERERHA